MLQRLDSLSGAKQPARTTGDCFSIFPHDIGTTNGTFGGRLDLPGTLRSPVGDDLDDFRNHIAGATYNHGIPTLTSFRCSSSMLCNVALLTVTPPTNTGSRRATGVTAPVRPT